MSRLRRLGAFDGWLASGALLLMVIIPLVEIVLRPTLGQGVKNAAILVQHAGLVLAMFGALLAERGGHLLTLGSGLSTSRNPRVRTAALLFSRASTAVLCGMLGHASWTFVASEMEAPRELAYGVSGWMVEAAMPIGFVLLGARIASRMGASWPSRAVLAFAVPGAGFLFAGHFDGMALPFWPFLVWLAAILACGAPVFAVLGGLSLALFWQDGQPLAAVPLSHYQITVNPSLPALPLFTLAGLIYARSGAAVRLGALFTALFGTGVRGTAVAAAVLCSAFTAFTGGSGVTILALGGLLLPLLARAGFPERRGISLVTSASALGVLLAPSVPLIMYAVIARVPINTMFLAGVLPALLMVACLLWLGGYVDVRPVGAPETPPVEGAKLQDAIWAARWEILAPFVAIGSLAAGLATPTESAALTVGYTLLTQALGHREIAGRALWAALAECVQVIGGIMLILGMALGLTNFLIDAGVPDAAIEWVQSVLPNRLAFLVALNIFLLGAGAVMEIYAAIVVLVPILLPVALSYGIDPVHFGVIFLANLEMAFLCPPAGMNVYFASSMFGKPVHYIAASVLPAVLAMLVGALVISALPFLATWLPSRVGLY